jgi:hypothetical protein
MSSDRPLRRVIAVAPMPPEKSAYALAPRRTPSKIASSGYTAIHRKNSGNSSTLTTAMRQLPISVMSSFVSKRSPNLPLFA